ncbi:MAG TPA: hypothetical protein VM925_35505 [Labilithrix sp.]|nr:hypothetical protein [Labilithrix sp.]
MRLAPVLTTALLLATSTAFAQQPSPQAPAPADYEQRQVPNQQSYPTPLYQQTQPSYVPQSVAMSGPREISNYNEGDAVPPGYRPVARMRKGLVIAGSIVFGTMYFFSALGASVDADSHNPSAQALWVPAVGPFIQMASTDSATGKFFLAIDGIGQSGGLFMLVYGLTSPKTVLVRNDLAKTNVRVLPMAGPGTSGLQLAGSF